VTWKQRGTVAAALPLRRYSGIPRPALPFSFCDFFLVSTSAAGKVNFAWPARVHRINRSTREQALSPPPKPISTNSYLTSGPPTLCESGLVFLVGPRIADLS